MTGGFHIHGSDTMHALMRRLTTEFQLRQPKIAIDVRSDGSTQAIGEFLEVPPPGRIAIKEERAKQPVLVSSSRALGETEIAQFASQRGYRPLAVPIAVDALALYVHKDNPLPGLTLDQVDAVFSSTRLRGYAQEIVKWSDLTPSAATVADQTYPLRRLLYLYIDKPPETTLPTAVEEFLAFITSREGQEVVMRAGFYPLPVKQLEAVSAALHQ